MKVAGEMSALLSENQRLRERIKQLESELYEEQEQADDGRHFSMRRVDELIGAGLWIPGVREELQPYAK
jgi:hypothetical protein